MNITDFCEAIAVSGPVPARLRPWQKRILGKLIGHTGPVCIITRQPVTDNAIQAMRRKLSLQLIESPERACEPLGAIGRIIGPIRRPDLCGSLDGDARADLEPLVEKADPAAISHYKVTRNYSFVGQVSLPASDDQATGFPAGTVRLDSVTMQRLLSDQAQRYATTHDESIARQTRDFWDHKPKPPCDGSISINTCNMASDLTFGDLVALEEQVPPRVPEPS